MPHISKKKLDDKTVHELETYLSSIMENTGARTRTQIFNELLTKTEKIMLAKRLGILFLLQKGMSLYKISETLGISPSTAERFQNALDKKAYNHTVAWLYKQTPDGKFDEFMTKLVALAFTGRTRSLKKIIDEW